VDGLDELEGGNVRASDRDRDGVAEELHIHCAQGRIDIDELERRLERAMSASTIHQLAELVYDLPNIQLPTQPTASPTRVRIGPPGIRPFTQRIEVPLPIARVRDMSSESLAVGLNAMGYELTSQSPTSLQFIRSAKERLTIDLEPRGQHNTTMIVHGRASRRIRKQFARLNSRQ